MSSSRKWKFRVRHILEAISGARSYIAGLTLDDLRGDAKTVDAVLTKLIVIGEAAALVPLEVQDRHPEVPWRKLKGLRNVIVHQYDRVDVGIVWNVIQGDLPPLVTLLEKVLHVEPGDWPRNPAAQWRRAAERRARITPQQAEEAMPQANHRK